MSCALQTESDLSLAHLRTDLPQWASKHPQRACASVPVPEVGGHSYGAFMTANLLARTDLFCAGIARSGAYNRTLTPFGFQAEERTFWEAPATYGAMSPFFHADKIRAPLLLIHGEADNNPGTFPMQSERLYQALKGLGKAARLCVLPNEAHFYRARTSIMHTLAEQDAWLEEHVRKAELPRTDAPAAKL